MIKEDFDSLDYNTAKDLASQLLSVQGINPNSNPGIIIGILVGVSSLLILLIGAVSFVIYRRYNSK